MNQPNPASNPSTVAAKPVAASSFEEILRTIGAELLLLPDGTLTTREPGESAPAAVATAPALQLRHLGDPAFCRAHDLSYPLVAGSMAKGISSAAIVEAMGKAGMLGFFGAAGLPLETVEAAAERIAKNLGSRPYGFNLIHSPHEPDLEAALVDLYIRRGIRLIEASAFLDLTLPVVRYRVHGIHQDKAGRIVTPNRIIAKVSREEVAAKFFAPPPQKWLDKLVAAGEITAEQAQLAARIPMAQDVTAEADSGGHTDNRPAIALFPTIAALRDRMQAAQDYPEPLRVGLGGGIATPASAAAGFALGAAYLVTGSVNQACVESGTCDAVRKMLAETRQADVTMAPAADMFEMGVDVQVLKRGTMFPMRAAKLYEIYRSCAGLDDIPAAEREKLEKTLFRAPLEEIWRQTRDYFLKRDPRQVERAERDPKHLMALVFRWYLGLAAHWANDGEASRKMDYQVWCGPAMGAFNEWARGSFLEQPENRQVVPVSLNILFGAAVLTRINILRFQGVQLPAEALQVPPLEPARIKEYLR